MRQKEQIERLADAMAALLDSDDPDGYYGHHVATGEPDAVANWQTLREGVTIEILTSASSPIISKFGALQGRQIRQCDGHRVRITHTRSGREALSVSRERMTNGWLPADQVGEILTIEQGDAEIGAILRYLVVERALPVYYGSHQITAAEVGA